MIPFIYVVIISLFTSTLGTSCVLSFATTFAHHTKIRAPLKPPRATKEENWLCFSSSKKTCPQIPQIHHAEVASVKNGTRFKIGTRFGIKQKPWTCRTCRYSLPSLTHQTAKGVPFGGLAISRFQHVPMFLCFFWKQSSISLGKKAWKCDEMCT